jgi:hypothetical protein
MIFPQKSQAVGGPKNSCQMMLGRVEMSRVVIQAKRMVDLSGLDVSGIKASDFLKSGSDYSIIKAPGGFLEVDSEGLDPFGGFVLRWGWWGSIMIK